MPMISTVLTTCTVVGNAVTFDLLRQVCASDTPDVDVIDRLLRDTAVDPSANDNELLRHSCMRGRQDLVRLLLRDARVSANNGKILLACEK